MEQIYNQYINHGRIPCPVGIVKHLKGIADGEIMLVPNQKN